MHDGWCLTPSRAYEVLSDTHGQSGDDEPVEIQGIYASDAGPDDTSGGVGERSNYTWELSAVCLGSFLLIVIRLKILPYCCNFCKLGRFTRHARVK